MNHTHNFKPGIALSPWCDCKKDGKCQGKCLGSNIEHTVKEAYGTQGLAFLKAHLREGDVVEDEKGLYRETCREVGGVHSED